MDMKRLLFCICAIMTVVIAMAEDVTPAEALKQATQFVQNRIASGQHSRRAAGTQAQLTQTGKVSGLYVFNVDNNGGFVIVSNDDRTEPILGYSDSGTFDPNNMPENMRAWLQGYADEIAWLKKHPDAAVSTSRRTGESESNIKTPILPLLETKWNQGTPYNNLCPYYLEDEYGNILAYSVEYVDDDYEHCATGCVATAMAQVMKYYEWPAQATESISFPYNSRYKWHNNTMPSLPSVVFDWANMIDDYESVDYSDTQAAAVATLMKYCGYSVKMDYGPSSGAASNKVADALTTYFNYESTTVSKNRNYYTYANWIELLYHELKEGRVVLYHGASTGGGHAFVCDGYQGEDYFHINWGWGGTSDSYFKLSAMNPYDQGIGGSSSKDGFSYFQGAIVGIQKHGGTGTVLDLDETPNLSFISVSLSRSTITLGESVDVTFRVRNNSSKNIYDGDIYVCEYFNANDYDITIGKNFVINPGETKDCTITYTPKGFTGTVIICPGYPGSVGGSYGYDTSLYEYLTVSSSTANNNVEMTISNISVDNAKLDYHASYDHYKLYGEDFNATVRLSNNTNTDYNGTFLWVLIPAGESAPINDIDVYVPAHSYKDIPISVKELDNNYSYYVFETSYIKNNSYSWTINGYYHPNPAIMSYAADGTKTVTIPSGTSYDAATNAPDALAIDVTGTNITSITPNTQPNAVYIYSGTMPSGLDNKNVIKYDGDKYTAQKITLTDNNGFYSPVDFTAANITFNYDFTVAADGEDEYGRGHGWNTLMLPFNVTKVTATDKTTHEEKDIDWFHRSTDKSKNFWVKKFTSDAVNTVNFDFTDEMNANTPYIVAFPGNKWGSKWDMSNKELRFIGKKVAVSKGSTLSSVTGANYRFIGNTIQDNTENIYSINSDGSAFDINESNGSAPFRAYIKPGTFDRSVMSLAIGSEPEGTTGIEDVNLNVNKNENGNFFNLNGQRVTRPTKGLYISNGKKVIIK